MEFVFSSKFVKKYVCECCDHSWDRKYDYSKHLLTDKHKNAQNGNENDENGNQKIVISFACKCSKSYNTKSGLWKHKKKCNEVNKNLEYKDKNDIISEKDIILDKNLIIEILKQNQELQKQIFEIIKDGKTIINNTINNTNQSFNMNLFLNEQCKDALNIGEFVNTLPLTLEDLENTGRVGYVKGITDIVIRGLKSMDVHKRPIHCSDLKREIIYVKDNDVWQKDEDNVKVKKAIQNIGTRNFMQVKEWVEKNPEAKDINTKKHDQYVEIRIKCTGGSDKEEDNKMQNKILSSIAKVVHIDKQSI